jgi:hypothetical protein
MCLLMSMADPKASKAWSIEARSEPLRRGCPRTKDRTGQILLFVSKLAVHPVCIPKS